MWLDRFAPAKVNLFLHVGPVASDGYHPVCSLMTFADVGDVVRLRTGYDMRFSLEGEFAGGLGCDSDNLVTRARDLLLSTTPSPTPFELVLEKRLPIAAGLGGGSADAAATLALVNSILPNPASPERLAVIARALGADVTACLQSLSVIGLGRGDDLSPAPSFPTLAAVLVNPMAPSPTGPVYRAFDRLSPGAGADVPPLPDRFADTAELLDFLNCTRNDLEKPAVDLQPLVGDVLAELRRHSQALFTRMSGSGATCFALCADFDSAQFLARRLSDDHSDWWIQACRLNV